MEEQCEHEACKCEIPKGQRFCSTACQQAAGDEKRCECGHPDCE